MERVPVLIVGAGGAGLSLALLLSQQGVRPTVVERRASVSWYPRARNLNFRTLEVLRGLGLEPAVVAAGSRVSRVFRKSSLVPADEEAFPDIERELQVADDLSVITPEPAFWHCPQSRLEPILLAEARRRGVDVRYDTELPSFTQDEEGVTATVADHATGAPLSPIRARYLAVCDGAHSRIREALGVKVDGVGVLAEYYVFVYFRVDWRGLMRGRETDAVLVQNSDVQGFFLATEPDHGMMMIRYDPSRGQSAADFTPERCRELIVRGIGWDDLEIKVEDVDHWQPVQLVAERFQHGRALLVGDAAHAMPPYLGLGVNTAIQSAQNLGWKLAAVLDGTADPQLLRTYHTERHPVAEYVTTLSLKGPAASLLSPASTHDAAGAPEREGSPGSSGLFSAIVGYRYISAAVRQDGAGPASAERVELLTRAALTGQPGTRVPHLWVERDAQRVSTLDLFDGHFVVIAGADGEPWCTAARSAARALGVGVAAYRIGPAGELRDLDDRWGAATGLPADGALLVRPDGFVAWRAAAAGSPGAPPADELVRVLSSVLGRPAPR